MSNFRPFSAIRCLVYLGTKRVGYAQGVSVRPNVMGSPIKELGDIYAKRIEPVDSDAGGNFDYIHILDAPLAQLVDSSGRHLWGTHMLSNRQWIEYDPPPLTLVDQYSTKRVITCLGVFPDSQSFQLALGGMMQVGCGFRCTRAFEHSESIFTGPAAIQGDVPVPPQGIA